MAPFNAKGKVEFGPFELNLSSGELCRSGRKQRLPWQSFQILALLISRPNELVTREELRDSVWASGTFVDFSQGLNNAVRRLRLALQDSAESPRYIETVPRRGYRFIAELKRSVSEKPWKVAEPLVLSHPSSAEMPVRAPSTLEVNIYRLRRALVPGLVLLAVNPILTWLVFAVAKTHPKPSVQSSAVLPFRATHPDRRYLADGVSEKMTFAPAKVGLFG